MEGLVWNTMPSRFFQSFLDNGFAFQCLGDKQKGSGEISDFMLYIKSHLPNNTPMLETETLNKYISEWREYLYYYCFSKWPIPNNQLFNDFGQGSGIAMAFRKDSVIAACDIMYRESLKTPDFTYHETCYDDNDQVESINELDPNALNAFIRFYEEYEFAFKKPTKFMNENEWRVVMNLRGFLRNGGKPNIVDGRRIEFLPIAHKEIKRFAIRNESDESSDENGSKGKMCDFLNQKCQEAGIKIKQIESNPDYQDDDLLVFDQIL